MIQEKFFNFVGKKAFEVSGQTRKVLSVVYNICRIDQYVEVPGAAIGKRQLGKQINFPTFFQGSNRPRLEFPEFLNANQT